MNRPLTDKDRAFLERHRKLGQEAEGHRSRIDRGTNKAVEISCVIRSKTFHQDNVTPRSYMIFDGMKYHWLPAQYVAIVEGGVQIPEWLAKDRGLI